MRIKVRINDEISLVNGDLFDKHEATARGTQNNRPPFGGIQSMVLVPSMPGHSGRDAKFSFDISTWNTSIQRVGGI